MGPALAGIAVAAASVALLWLLRTPVRRLPRRAAVALGIAAWIVETVILLFGPALVFGAMGMGADVPPPLSMLWAEALQAGSLVGALLALAVTWHVPSFGDVGLALAGSRVAAYRDVAFGLVLGPAAVSVFLVAGLIGGWDHVAGFAPAGQLLPDLAIGALLFACVAVFEEVSTRGCLFGLLARAVGVPAAAIVSVVLFALLHLANRGAGPFAILGVGLAGAVFLLAFWRTGRLWLPIAFHLGWDWAETSLFGFPDSGIPPAGALRLAIDPQAPAWATGGAFGPEASAFVLVALALAAAAIWLYTRGRDGSALLFPGGAPERAG